MRARMAACSRAKVAAAAADEVRLACQRKMSLAKKSSSGGRPAPGGARWGAVAETSVGSIILAICKQVTC